MSRQGQGHLGSCLPSICFFGLSHPGALEAAVAMVSGSLATTVTGSKSLHFQVTLG